MIKEKKYKIELKTLEPLRIGGPKDPLSGADNPIAIVGGKVVIPGSTLKGALRNEMERYLVDLFYDKERKQWPEEYKGIQPCIPSPETNLSKDEKKLIEINIYKKENCKYPGSLHICPVCYLLGAMGVNGFVRVPFLFSDISPESLYSTRSDRAKGTVVHGTNRPYQLLPKETVFKGVLTLLIEDDILDWSLGKPRDLKESTESDKWLLKEEWTQEKIIKELLIERLKNIKLLGGYKSKGFGAVQISVVELE